MPEALTRYAPHLLPVPYTGAESRPALQVIPAGERADEFRAEPPRSEVRFASRFTRNDEPTRVPLDSQALFAAQQVAQESQLQLARAKPQVAGYASYAATVQQTDPSRPRPGQILDRSV